MKQRRFFAAKGEEGGEWFVLDAKRHPPHVICKCVGWNAPKNATLIVAALEAHHSELYSKFATGDSGRPNNQSTVKVLGDTHSPATFEPVTGKRRAKRRG
jgi:hypothetical protein